MDGGGEDFTLGCREPLTTCITIDYNIRIIRKFRLVLDADHAPERLPYEIRGKDRNTIIQLSNAASGRISLAR
jgi:hypothetical protein